MRILDFLDPILDQAETLLQSQGREMPPQVRKVREIVRKGQDVAGRIPAAGGGMGLARLILRGVDRGLGRHIEGVPALDSMLSALDGFLEVEPIRAAPRDVTRRSRIRPSMKIRLQDTPDGGVRMSMTDDKDATLNRTWEFPAGTDRRQAMRTARRHLDWVMEQNR